MTTTHTKADPRALKVAEELHQRLQPSMTILFGSRARGDYEDGRSDIDIMLVGDSLPSGAAQLELESQATSRAQKIYGCHAPVQLIIQTTEEFGKMRRTVNHVTVHALREGIIMSQDAEYNGQNFSNEEEDYSHEWSLTEERLRHAERHLAAFNVIVEAGLHDSMVGQHAQGAMEHALKALISARVERYPHIHDIDDLVARARRVDRRFRFALSIPGRIYNQYVGSDEYREAKEPITAIDDYRNLVNSDVQTVMERVREIGQSRLQ